MNTDPGFSLIRITYRIGNQRYRVTQGILDPPDTAGPGTLPIHLTELLDSLPEKAWITDIRLERLEP